MTQADFGPIRRDRAKMTVLRLALSHAVEDPFRTGDAAPGATKALVIVFELEHSGSVVATWRVGAGEMTVPATAHELQDLREDLLALSQGLMTVATDQLRRFVSEKRVDWLVNFLAPRASLPDRLLRSLSRTLHALPAWDNVLWLEFGDSRGHLAQMPWERLLRRRLPISVLRLPYHSVKPLLTNSSLEMVLCCSAASPGDMISDRALRDLASTIGSALPRAYLLRVFADAVYRERLRRLLPAEREGGRQHIQEYSGPATAPSEFAAAGPEPGGNAADEHPWLTWLRAGMAGRAVDVVHFVAGARWSGERSFLAVSRFPGVGDEKEPPNLVRLVTTTEVDRFLTEVGASSVAFTATGGAASRFALRHFVDALAKRRPGAIVLHDPSLDSDWTGLASTFRFLFSMEDAPPPQSDGITLVCHPWKLRDAAVQDDEPEILRQFRETTRVVKEVVDAPDTPSWVASSQRYFEKAYSHAIDATPCSALEEAAQRGTQEALDDLSRVVASHVSSIGKPSS